MDKACPWGFLWTDNWHQLGPLYQRFGESVVFNSGRSVHTSVASIIQNGMWKSPRAKNAITREILAGNFAPNPLFLILLLNANGRFFMAGTLKPDTLVV